MIAKVANLFKDYGVVYTVKKVLHKLYVSYLLGPLKVNRRITKEERIRQEQKVFPDSPVISLLVPLYNTPELFLRQMIESVLAQTYKNWQLCLTDGSDSQHIYVQELCETYASGDNRIRYRKLEKNLGISENTNACIEMATGEFIGLFDHDDLLHPSALFEVVKCISEEKADFIYTDEATFLGAERHLLSVHYKPDFCMENLRANNYICHFTVFQRKLLKKTGVFRKEFDGSQDHDMILRLCEQATKICHVPKVLYFWRAHENSVALSIDSKNYAVDAGLRAVKEHLDRCGLPAEVTVAQGAMSIYQIKYDLGNLDVSNVTVFREEECSLENIKQKTKKSKEYILLLKAGMMIPAKTDLEYLLMHMGKQNVSAVTAKIVGENGKVLSGGVEVSERKRKLQINHLYRGIPASAPGYMNRLTYASGIPVICNGCMLVRKVFVEEALERGQNLFKLEDWVKMSFRMRKEGNELINEPRTAVRSERALEKIVLQMGTRDGIIVRTMKL